MPLGGSCGEGHHQDPTARPREISTPPHEDLCPDGAVGGVRNPADTARHDRRKPVRPTSYAEPTREAH